MAVCHWVCVLLTTELSHLVLLPGGSRRERWLQWWVLSAMRLETAFAS